MLSNTIWTRDYHREVFERDGVLDLLDADVYSSEIPWVKPHPEVFRAACDAVGVEPEEGVYVGDRLFEDVHGPQQVGMRAIWMPHSDIPRGPAGRRRRRPPTPQAHELLDILDIVDRVARARAGDGERVADPTLTHPRCFLGARGIRAPGWIDAVVGGGGLVQLPALLVGLPGATPAQLLATNKFGSIFGTATSSVTYYRRVRPDLRTALPMAAVAYVGAIGGALIGLHIPKSAFNPIILVLLVARRRLHDPQARPRQGVDPALRRRPAHGRSRCSPASSSGSTTARSARAPAASSSSRSSGCSATTSSRRAPRPRSPTSRRTSARCTVFLPRGLVLFKVGAVMAVGQPRSAATSARARPWPKGSGFVRVVFIVVLVAFIVRIGGSVLGFWA